MLQKLLDTGVNVVLQILLDGAEVHGVLDVLEVVVNAFYLFGVHWLVEDKRTFVSPQGIHHSLGCFLPVV